MKISCEVDLRVFSSKEEWQKHDKLRNRQRDYYFDILDQLQGKQNDGNPKIDISEIKPEYTEKQKSELAWKIALDRVQQ